MKFPENCCLYNYEKIKLLFILRRVYFSGNVFPYISSLLCCFGSSIQYTVYKNYWRQWMGEVVLYNGNMIMAKEYSLIWYLRVDNKNCKYYFTFQRVIVSVILSRILAECIVYFILMYPKNIAITFAFCLNRARFTQGIKIRMYTARRGPFSDIRYTL